MALSLLQNFLYLPPASMVVTTMSVVSFLSMSNGGWLEINGKHMQYSKLGSVASQSSQDNAKFPSRIGMMIVYTPAFLAGLSSFFLLPDGDLRLFLLRLAVTTHFFKRIFEVLIIHKFSGYMGKEAATTISISYFLSSATIIYSQLLSQELPEPYFDLKYPGILIFLLGICGNFYHHYLLSNLRGKGENQYKIPRGGLFNLVICPHYLFEILGFWGIVCISQTVYSFALSMGVTLYLMGRSYATKNWYQSKFEDFPKDVKAIFPFIF